MNKQNALIAIALVASFGALAVSLTESVMSHRRVETVERPAMPLTTEKEIEAAAAKQLADSLTGLRESIKKANPAQRTKIRPAPRPNQESGSQP